MNIIRLKEILDEKGILAKDLATKVGMTATGISNINQGSSLPKKENLLKIAEVLDIDLRELFISTKPDAHSEPIYIKKGNEFILFGNIKLENHQDENPTK